MKPSQWLFRLSCGVLIVIILIAVFGPFVLPSAFGSSGRGFLPPGDGHLLGTDVQGRDVMARLAMGARVSLGIGVVVELIAVLIGVVLGTLAVLGPSWTRTIILRITDVMFAFPDILLAILIAGVIYTGIASVIAALAITAWPGVVRIVKTQTSTLRNREFVIAAEANGASPHYIVIRHILPHLTGLLLAVTIVDLAGVILAESALSFLGIGVQPPIPSWGSMINDARLDMQSHPWMLVWPCTMLCFSVFALNFVGEGFRSLWDRDIR